MSVYLKSIREEINKLKLFNLLFLIFLTDKSSLKIITRMYLFVLAMDN